jgi:hypothetical protein
VLKQRVNKSKIGSKIAFHVRFSHKIWPKNSTKKLKTWFEKKKKTKGITAIKNLSQPTPQTPWDIFYILTLNNTF